MATSTSPTPLLLRALSPHSTPHSGITPKSLLFVGATPPYPFLLRAPSRHNSMVAFAKRKKNSPATTRTKTSRNKKSMQAEAEDDDIDEDAIEALFNQLEEDLKNNLSVEGDEIDEDAFEALFSQLEEDLKHDNLSDADDADEEITEDLARLEQDLEDTLGDNDSDESSGSSSLNLDDEADQEVLPKLKNWQLRRLARAVKVGRRKTSIKNLATELGLDRALVLELLRNPPPNLLLLSVSLPDEVTLVPPEPETAPTESPPVSKPEAGVPVHVMRSRWSMQKRLKKAQVETLERVYARTKRPTNAMIGSIVHVTNLPSKRVVQWFEEKRVEDGVPDQRVPFRRATPEAVSTG